MIPDSARGGARIAIRALRKHYELRAHGEKAVRKIEVLCGVDLDIQAGEMVSVVGASGAGKSTLLHVLGALDPDYQGEVTLDGAALGELSDAQRAALRNRTLGFVFQAYNLLSQLTALENVLLPQRFASGAVDVERGRAVLASVGLGAKAHRKPAQLSGGERQRVAIARALVQRPKLVLCDEPTGNLDQETGAQILGLFERLTAEGVALLIATHDDAIARGASRVLRLREGRLV
jgi:putative ABC transport system ATP-binding protein